MKLSWEQLLMIFLVCFAAGAGVAWYYSSYQVPTEKHHPADLFGDKFFDSFYNDDFFNRSRDPFQEMDRVRAQLQQEIDRISAISGGQLTDNFDQWFSSNFGNSPAGKIRMSEDKEFIYYSLDIDGVDSEEVIVEVKDSMVEITAKLQSRTEKAEGNSLFSSTRVKQIHQFFPVPAGTDPTSIKVLQETGKVVIRFTKLKAKM
jgi:HSP20 family molecular chaperone IbpA